MFQQQKDHGAQPHLPWRDARHRPATPTQCTKPYHQRSKSYNSFALLTLTRGICTAGVGTVKATGIGIGVRTRVRMRIRMGPRKRTGIWLGMRIRIDAHARVPYAGTAQRPFLVKRLPPGMSTMRCRLSTVKKAARRPGAFQVDLGGCSHLHLPTVSAARRCLFGSLFGSEPEILPALRREGRQGAIVGQVRQA